MGMHNQITEDSFESSEMPKFSQAPPGIARWTNNTGHQFTDGRLAKDKSGNPYKYQLHALFSCCIL
jgi:hypothetical protein